MNRDMSSTIMHAMKDIGLWRVLRYRTHPIWSARDGVVCDKDEVHGSNQNGGGGVRCHVVIIETAFTRHETSDLVEDHGSSVRSRAFPHLR